MSIAIALGLLQPSAVVHAELNREKAVSGTIVVILLERHRATVSTDSLFYDPEGPPRTSEKVTILGNRIIFTSAGMSNARVELKGGGRVEVNADELARQVYGEMTATNRRASIEQIAFAFRDRQQQAFGQLIVKGWRSIEPYMKADGGLLDVAFVGLDSDGRIRMTHMHFYAEVSGNQATLTVRNTQTYSAQRGPGGFGPSRN